MSRAKRVYNVLVTPAEEGGFWAQVVELPGCVTQGETEEELLDNIMEAIDACLEAGTEPMHNVHTTQPQLWKVPIADGAAA